MSLHTIDCPASEAIETTAHAEPARMRYDLIVRARREIREGRYDNGAEIDRMLDECMDRIADDVQTA